MARRWRWVPPPGWPEPPPGWFPGRDWQPDPAWPPVPPGHVFWRKLPRSRRARAGLLALILLPLGGCGAFVAMAAHDPTGCGFDPPPGNMRTLPVDNDTSQELGLFTCRTAACTSGYDDDGPAIAPGGLTDLSYETCDGFSVGVTAADGRLVGCFVLPIGVYRPVPRVWLSEANSCPASVAAGTHPHLYTPG